MAGCLAQPEQEGKVQGIVESMGELGVFGTIREAQGIIESAWKGRDAINRDAWDFAACLWVLGKPALLV